jgi:hypothetical protein
MIDKPEDCTLSTAEEVGQIESINIFCRHQCSDVLVKRNRSIRDTNTEFIRETHASYDE